MALITLGALASDIKGKVGGNVFQRSGSGLIMRRSGGSVNKRTQNQNINRLAMVRIQQAWQNLTDTNRVMWNTYARQKNQSTRKSALVKLNGQQIFIRENTLRLNYILNGGVLAPEILVTPVITAPPAINYISSIHTGGADLNIVLNTALDTAVGFNTYWISSPKLGSQTSGHAKKKIISLVGADSVTQEISAEYTAAYGILPAVGSVLEIEMSYYQFSLKQPSPTSSQRITVVAT